MYKKSTFILFVSIFTLSATLSSGATPPEKVCLNGDPNCSGGFLPGAPTPQFEGGVSQQNLANINDIALVAVAMIGGSSLGPVSSALMMGGPTLNGVVTPPQGDGVNEGTAQ